MDPGSPQLGSVCVQEGSGHPTGVWTPRPAPPQLVCTSGSFYRSRSAPHHISTYTPPLMNFCTPDIFGAAFSISDAGIWG